MCKEAVITKRTAEFDNLHTLLIRVVGSNPGTFLLGGDCADGVQKVAAGKRSGDVHKVVFENAVYVLNDS